MTRADKIFIENCKQILRSHYTDEGMRVRPKWDDGTPAHTRKCFGIVNRYDLREEFPIMTLRQVFWKTALDEIFWIYQRKSSRIADLKSKIWDSWDVGDGTIGKAYGYQIAQKTTYPDGTYDQMDRVLKDLMASPMSRSIITSTYNIADLPEMGLRPCAYSMTYNVTRDPNSNRMVLNAILNQRSQDMLTANNWNTVQYAMLLMMVAGHVDMIPGELVHVIADAHIYDRHEGMVLDLIEKADSGKCDDYKAPSVHIITDGKPDFYKLSVDSFVMKDYEFDTTKYVIPVAI